MPTPPNPYIKTVQVAAPAAGAEFAIRAPGEGLWRVLSLAFNLVTDATVANRAVSLTADDGTSVYFSTDATAFQAAALTRGYSAWEGSMSLAAISGDAILGFPTRGLWLPVGHSIRSVTTAIQAGDQYAAINAMVEEFPTGPSVEWVPTVARAEYGKV